MLCAKSLTRRYYRDTRHANCFYPVRDVSLELHPGEVVVLTGRSGSGKTTLLHMLAGLLPPTEGEVLLDDVSLYTLPDAALSRLRAEKIAVVPQGRSAVETLTVLENILLPARLRDRPALLPAENAGFGRRELGSRSPSAQPRRTLSGVAGDAEAACRWMDALNIGSLSNVRPAELSGGELRRMAIARALTQDADVLLADEPTGDLDDENTERVLDIFADAAHAHGKAVLIVSHDSAALRIADRQFRMDGGTLSETVDTNQTR